MSDALASFETQLRDVLKKKPPISASTTAELTKLAGTVPKDDIPKLVARIESIFISSPKPYRLSYLYLLDSICKTKNDTRKIYVESLSTRLHQMVGVMMKEGSEKDQESTKKLARIWLEKRVFSESTLALVAQILQQTVAYILPGSESLPPPPAISPVPVAPAQSAPYLGPFPPSQLPPSPTSYLNSYPQQMSNAYPPTGAYPPFTPIPVPAPAAASLVDDLSKLGDLNALLGSPSVVTPQSGQQQPPSRYPAIDPRYPPPPHSEGHFGGDYRHQGGEGRYNAPDNRFPMDPRQTPSSGYRQPGPFEGAPQRPNNNFPRDQQHHQPYQAREGFRSTDPADDGASSSGGPIYSATLFVGSLPPGTTDQDMRDMFSPFGSLRRVTLKADRGIAFIAFQRRPDAEKAKNSQDNSVFGNKTLRIRWAKSDQHRDGTVDPETGLMSFGDSSAASSSSASASSSSPTHQSFGRRDQAHQHGIPRGLRPQIESSFADGYDAPYNNGSQNRYGNNGNDEQGDDSGKGKRRYEGDQPQGSKRRFDENDGFQSMTTWSDRN